MHALQIISKGVAPHTHNEWSRDDVTAGSHSKDGRGPVKPFKLDQHLIAAQEWRHRGLVVPGRNIMVVVFTISVHTGLQEYMGLQPRPGCSGLIYIQCIYSFRALLHAEWK